MYRLLEAALLATALLVSATLAGAQDAPARPIEVRVLPRVEVLGEEFTLGEVAEVDGPVLETARQLAAISLGRSPLPGRSLRLNESYLRARLAGAPDAERLKLLVPSGAEVVRASQVITGDELAKRVLDVAESQANAAGGDVEQELATPMQEAVLPMGEVEWEIAPMGRYLSAGGSRSYRVVARMHGEEVYRTVARVNQQVFRKLVIAARPIRRNQIVRSEDVILERRSVVGIKDEDFLTRAAEAVGARAKRPIGQGERLRKDLLVAMADVAEGGPVVLVYQTEQMRFSTPGVAMVPAKVGEFIPVRNLQSGRIVYGVVQNDETVKVN